MQEIQEQLKALIKKLYDLDFEADITPAPANVNADYSSNAPLKLAGALHKSPIEIAEEIKNQLNILRVSLEDFKETIRGN